MSDQQPETQPELDGDRDTGTEMDAGGSARRDGFAAVAMFVMAVLFVVWIASNIL
jgi:hypothetical protein